MGYFEARPIASALSIFVDREANFVRAAEINVQVSAAHTFFFRVRDGWLCFRNQPD
jgi:hypothetical protein